MKRLPLDTSSFKQIRERGWVYVDKTPWIHRLVTEGICYFLSRPRRFGKSLTINTLKELFRGNRKLFEGLYIYDKWDFAEHPV
ncbi:AAA family ATPase, partial [Thermosulfurimonas sp.]|uniref:AAA family ATPase n=1 Tax=Thermosulfurimonas sp. TaxID=2080236 RepID=UPI0025EFF49D